MHVRPEAEPVVAHQAEALHVTASADSVSATGTHQHRRLNGWTKIVELEPTTLCPIVPQSRLQRQKVERREMGTAPAILEFRLAFNDYLSYTKSSRNLSSRHVVAAQTKSTLDIRDDTPSHSSTDVTDLTLQTDDDAIVAFSQKRSYRVCLSVGMPYSSLHPVVSTFDTGVESY